MRSAIRLVLLVLCAVLWMTPFQAHAQLNVLAVDCTPFVNPGFTAFGPDNTIGMALQQVDPANVLFSVTEVDPPTFRAMTLAQLQSFDLIAVNNRRDRINDFCAAGSPGLGVGWHAAVGVNSGGRVVLTSHDAPRFHLIVPPFSTSMGSAAGPCPGCEPFGTFNFVRDAALWAGGGTCKPGLLVFNDSWAFDPLGGFGWNNPELNLPPAWGISDDQDAGIADGGHTDILAVYAAHPIYANVSDLRLVPNSISSFAANVGDNSWHSIFLTHNAAIFTVTEVMVNSGVVDVGGFGCCSGQPQTRVNGTPITLIRDESCPPVPTERMSWGLLKTRHE